MAGVRPAVRALRREPLQACASILTLALGIGAATAVFGVADALLLRPLPWPDADRVVYVEEQRAGQRGRSPWTVTNGTFHAWRERSETLESLAAWMPSLRILDERGSRERVLTSAVTPSLFAVLRPPPPALGRSFTEADARLGGPRVALLSFAFWDQHFGRDADIIGRTIVLDDRSYEIVGVMPRGFAFPDSGTRVWVPFQPLSLLSADGRQMRVIVVGAIARLAPGATVEQASAEATLRAQGVRDIRQAALSMFGARGDVSVALLPAPEVMTRDMRPAVLVLAGAVGLLLIGSVASIVGMRLARTLARRRETAVQVALGARFGQLARQWLVEGLLLGVCGGVAGLVAADAAIRLLAASLADTAPGLDGARLDVRMAAVSLGLTVGVGLLCGLIPAILVRRSVLEPAVGDVGGRGALGGPPRAGGARTLIMSAQVAVACLLLIGGMLLARSFVAMVHADRGFVPGGLLTARLTFPHDTSAARRTEVLERFRDRIGAVPGVKRAAFGSGLPLVSNANVFGRIVPSPRVPGEMLDVAATEHVVDPAYLDALGMRPTAGRWLRASDTPSSTPVVVVNEAFASRYLGGGAVGQRLELRVASRPVWEVAGVVADVRTAGLTEAAAPEFYVSYRQAPNSVPQDPFLLVRTDGDPASYVEEMRVLVGDLGSDLLLDPVMTMDVRMRTSLARPWAYAAVLGTLAVLGVLVVTTGLIGVLVYSMQQRRREIGVRLAVGARFADIMRLAARQVAVSVGAGVAAGMAAMSMLAAMVSTPLYGVTPHDALSFAAGGAIVAVAAAVACIVPARRAASVDPVRALRSE